MAPLPIAGRFSNSASYGKVTYDKAKKTNHRDQSSGFQSHTRGNLSAVKQAYKSDSVGLIVYGKLDKKRTGPDEEGWMLWIIKSGKPPRQVRIV
jgi:hypothetical protein